MSEYDGLIDGYELERGDAGPLTDEEHQALEETVGVLDLDPSPPSPPPQELRVLHPDQIPLVGVHYVIFEGKPRAVLRGNYAVPENEHVLAGLRVQGLKDHDGHRQARAERAIRMRYRGYLCGEVAGL